MMKGLILGTQSTFKTKGLILGTQSTFKTISFITEHS